MYFQKDVDFIGYKVRVIGERKWGGRRSLRFGYVEGGNVEMIYREMIDDVREF